MKVVVIYLELALSCARDLKPNLHHPKIAFIDGGTHHFKFIRNIYAKYGSKNPVHENGSHLLRTST